MILDERTEFADATALNTGAAGTYNLGDVVDLQGQTISPNATRDPFCGEEVTYLVIQVDTTVTSGGAATVEFRLVSDNGPTIATDGSASLHYSTGPVALANLGAGKAVAIVPMPIGQYERYLGVQQVTGVAALTAGKVNAFLTDTPSAFRAYADAQN